MSDRDSSAGSSATAVDAPAEPHDRSGDGSGDGPGDGPGDAPREARAWTIAFRGGLTLVALWLCLRGLRWLSPLLLAPSTEGVCRHLLALDGASAVTASAEAGAGSGAASPAPQAHAPEWASTGVPRTEGEGASAGVITLETCVGLVERRLQRRGLVAAAALRSCLGHAKSLDEAATCR